MTFTDKDLQKIIGAVLKYGVWLVLIIALTGGALYLINHGHETVHYEHFVENDRSIFAVLSETVSGAKNLQGEAIIFSGIFLLFLTPFIRLILSLISFILEKDLLYIFITVIVIGIICTSVYFGFAH